MLKFWMKKKYLEEMVSYETIIRKYPNSNHIEAKQQEQTKIRWK